MPCESRLNAAGQPEPSTMRAYFNIEREDARLYHIVLNTERLSIEACVKM